MPEIDIIGDVDLEVISPDNSRRVVPVTTFPFLIGRGGDTGNHLQLDDPESLASVPRLFPTPRAYFSKTAVTAAESS